MGEGSVAKMPTGIPGFDDLTGGGLPRGKTTVVLGAPGAGKTVFALQTLVNGARHWNEPGIFVAFEEQAAQVQRNAASFCWDLPGVGPESLFFLDAQIPFEVFQTGDFDLGGLLAVLSTRVQAMGARRIVFDAVDVLLSLLNDPVSERREIHRLRQWLGDQGITGILTVKGNGAEPFPSHYQFIPYMADCVVTLDYQVDDLVSVRRLRVVKYRGSPFYENETPLIISQEGMEVAGPDPMVEGMPASMERVSTGVFQLDEMLTGGYYRGTSVLITGVPGTAKSTLAAAFVNAACNRGEPALYISFDEGATEMIRNLRSVNIHLQPHVESGLLRLVSAYSGAGSAEAQYLRIRTLLAEQKPTCLVIDPLSAVLKAGGTPEVARVAERLIHTCRAMGITVLCTSLLDEVGVNPTATELRVSTLADTWIHLTYHDQGGERNRGLSIIKSRGTAHSNQIRELILSDEGISLANVYTAGGDVLMGTRRWEREETERQEQERTKTEVARKQRDLQLTETEVQARINGLLRELEARRAELDQLVSDQERREQYRSLREEEVRRLRRGNYQEEKI